MTTSENGEYKSVLQRLVTHIVSLRKAKMSRKTKDHARTHEENRGVICLLCLRKKDKMWDIVGPLITEVKNAVNINLNDIRYPSAVCSSCKIIIYKFNKQNSEETTLAVPDYSGFLELPCVTRSKNKILCDCKLCEIARRAQKKQNS